MNITLQDITVPFSAFLRAVADGLDASAQAAVGELKSQFYMESIENEWFSHPLDTFRASLLGAAKLDNIRINMQDGRSLLFGRLLLRELTIQCQILPTLTGDYMVQHFSTEPTGPVPDAFAAAAPDERDR